MTKKWPTLSLTPNYQLLSDLLCMVCALLSVQILCKWLLHSPCLTYWAFFHCLERTCLSHLLSSACALSSTHEAWLPPPTLTVSVSMSFLRWWLLQPISFLLLSLLTPSIAFSQLTITYLFFFGDYLLYENVIPWGWCLVLYPNILLSYTKCLRPCLTQNRCLISIFKTSAWMKEESKRAS